MRRIMMEILPTFGCKPSSGFTMGATRNLAKYLGDPATTRISSAVIGLSDSTKQRTSLTVRFGASGRENRWRLDGDNRFQWTSQDSSEPHAWPLRRVSANVARMSLTTPAQHP